NHQGLSNEIIERHDEVGSLDGVVAHRPFLNERQNDCAYNMIAIFRVQEADGWIENCRAVANGTSIIATSSRSPARQAGPS
ncbi:MAG: hypothetical protein QF805_31545, partial [Pirellulaceae bacterium]|nr:hypothetical protein [Pirellulaceae bacterium]